MIHILQRLRQQVFQRAQPSLPDGLIDPPIRGEILGIEQLEQHAAELAALHRSAIIASGDDRLRRALDRNEQRIATVYQQLAADARAHSMITPAAEWLLDNYHIVTQQIRQIRRDLPGGYYRELPKLTSGSLRGLPRVYAIALELIEHTDGRIELEALLRFIHAYQAVTPLTMGELWAVAIMLRVGLVENLARLASLVLDARRLRADADQWTEQLLAEGANVQQILAQLAEHYPQLPTPFTAQLLRRLRNHESDHDIGPIVRWLETQPNMPHDSIEVLIHAEHQRQAAGQMSVGNTITSMRTLSALDWDDWFERVSLVEQVLRQDPAGAYAHGTFATRDHYRHEVERLARGSKHSEDEVVRRLLARAAKAPAGRKQHVGYYLVDAGLPDFEAELGAQITSAERVQRTILRHPTAFYLGALGGTTAAIVAYGLKLAADHTPTATADQQRRNPAGQLALLGLLALPASALATELINRAVARIIPPRVLPRLDLSAGLPDDLRTAVVVPTLLLTPESVRGQIDALEVIALANNDPRLYFVLLSDLADAPQLDMPEDAELLDVALTCLQALNATHGEGRFFLLHRHRVWNAQQNCWMGWERKRGKLEEFNRLLAGDEETTFSTQIGDLAILRQARYVITLDSDTQLPRGRAHELIGTLAHPLNQAVLDPATRQIVKGYGILQPRVGIDPASATKSRFARIFSGNVGIDPYSTAVSDVYMDLFGEGIYAGKGIYDPAALRATVDERFPENALLSHDLIEGLYARTGLLSDVEVLDKYPATYASYAARLHRWVRGDWQVAPWLLPFVPGSNGATVRTTLSPIARYKLLDNLRRSLLPPATIALLAAGWTALPGNPLAWTALGLGYLAVNPVAELLAALMAQRTLRDWQSFRSGVQTSVDAVRWSMLRFVLNVAFLPDQALLNLDAIGRTLARMLVSRRNLLEWETAAQAESRLESSYTPVLRRTYPALGVAGLAGLAQLANRPPPTTTHTTTWLAACTPVITDWLFAPALAAWLDQPWMKPPAPLAADDQALLRRLARASWAYFDEFVTAEVNYLAPDNFQETPRPLAANRTSPTNIGLQLLADLAAYDFGYLGAADLIARTERVFETIGRLERHRGHLLNWYDTETLRVLPPAYVSTVDSGNLSGYLITLWQGLEQLRYAPIIGKQQLVGLGDTLALAEQHAAPSDDLQRLVASLRALLARDVATTAEYRALLADIAQLANALAALDTAAGWSARLERQVERLLDELDSLMPTAAESLPPSLAQLAVDASDDDAFTDDVAWPDDSGSATAVATETNTAAALLARITALQADVQQLLLGMDYSFLYDDQRRLFVIGYNVSEGRRDGSYYDLLASEARLASYLAIAKGDIPQEHWFALGRGLTAADGQVALVSWSGTMFEYLMPTLVMRNYPETQFDATYRAVIDIQAAYGRRHKVPWGISESAFNARDLSMNYQYRAFGVPGLGLKTGLADDLVIAPYATVLALPFSPADALQNIKALMRAGMSGAYGLYEAIDFTPDRLPHGANNAIVRSFMVHHQGMSLLALDNFLNANPMQARFHAEPSIQATETLLQERVSHEAPVRTESATPAAAVLTVSAALPAARQFTTPTTSVPYTHLLSNGRYSVMLTNSGAGVSSCDDLAITRWRADTTRDQWGSFVYVRDARSGATWSAAYQPIQAATQGYQAIYAPDHAEFHQRAAGIDTRMEIVVSPEDPVELRRITLTNLTAAPRELELTSYAEIVLAPQAADEAHPAFGNLFVETEFLAPRNALLASRRPRSSEPRRWAMHLVATRGHTVGGVEYDSDRASFVGRGHTTADPVVLQEPLKQHTGAVLDPVFSLRQRVRIVPGGSAQVTFVTALADDRDHALRLADIYHDHAAINRAFELAWTQSQVEMRHLSIGTDEAHRFQRLASAAIYTDPHRRARREVLESNTLGQPSLWRYGISGDYPIVLVQVGAGDELTLVQELLLAHQYWRLKRLTVDLVIINEDASGYTQGRQEQILALIRGRSGALLNQRGGIFLLRGDTLPDADRTLLLTVARVALNARRGELALQLRRREPDNSPYHLPPTPEPGELPAGSSALRLTTPFGGFSDDLREYVIELAAGMQTPAPWTNVIANQRFGFIVTERGGGYTWSENSRENRLTPWSNDPVCDVPGEWLYLRDEASGQFWSATGADGGAVRTYHGFGYTRFERQAVGIASQLTLSVAQDDSVKFYRVRLTNHSDQPRRISLTLYVEWVLGVFRDRMAPFVVTEHDEASHALLARNRYNSEFAERVAFVAASQEASVTADRSEFIGRNGSPLRPAAMTATALLSGSVGAGLDPCGALRCVIELAPGGEHELVFLLGQGDDASEARALIERYHAPATATTAIEQTMASWRDLLGQVQVATPQPEFDALLNGWLLYQTLACRIWGRSAFYQSSGAYGFRDQLQDVLALCHTRPDLVREQILRAAARQFTEGDVQHWWHPPNGRGIRTNFSDDYLWLPFVVAQYLANTGDTALLSEVVPFIEGRPLEPGEDEYYDLPTLSQHSAAIYDHCTRALDRGLKRMGEHGLPLMGSGDWNDGMNLVGHEGRGESVWVGWFLAKICSDFAVVAAQRGDQQRATRYSAESERLKHAVETHAWDGEWYLRAFFDDGTPLGSAASQECRIDSLTQSWALIAGSLDSARAQQAMRSLEQQLVDREYGLIKLFTPPFDQAEPNPGYIKGYLPGVRENGGQYTHAALWAIWAYTLLGDAERAVDLYALINPIRHSSADPERYTVEPYVIAADVYTAESHGGRGGWTWYTGSAGWMYRLGIEQILGIQRQQGYLLIKPCIPADWPTISLWYRVGATTYHIVAERGTQPAGSVSCDGQVVADGRIPLHDDGAEHEVHVAL